MKKRQSSTTVEQRERSRISPIFSGINPPRFLQRRLALFNKTIRPLVHLMKYRLQPGFSAYAFSVTPSSAHPPAYQRQHIPDASADLFPIRCFLVKFLFKSVRLSLDRFVNTVLDERKFYAIVGVIGSILMKTISIKTRYIIKINNGKYSVSIVNDTLVDNKNVGVNILHMCQRQKYSTLNIN